MTSRSVQSLLLPVESCLIILEWRATSSSKPFDKWSSPVWVLTKASHVSGWLRSNSWAITITPIHKCVTTLWNVWPREDVLFPIHLHINGPYFLSYLNRNSTFARGLRQRTWRISAVTDADEELFFFFTDLAQPYLFNVWFLLDLYVDVEFQLKSGLWKRCLHLNNKARSKKTNKLIYKMHQFAYQTKGIIIADLKYEI